MLRKTRLFTPGPTPLLPAAQLALASANLHHRTADFRALYTRTLADLKEFVGTQNDVLVLTSSGTGAMEASISNLTSLGDKVLVLSAGKFGERWRDLAKAYGCSVDVLSAPYGETFSEGVLRARLGPELRALYVQATESSTGARHDVEAIARTVHKSAPDARLDVDAWGIDILIGGSQKALMIPPGLAYCSVSDRAWRRMEDAGSPRYYFDLRKERKAAAKGESAFTPATSLIAALAAALDYVRQLGEGQIAVGREALIEGAELCAQMTRAAAQSLNLKLFAPSCPAVALTALVPPSGIDSGKIVTAFRENFGAMVANGQGEMKGKIFRIAHLGYYDYLDTIGIIAALEHVLAAAGISVDFGAGLRAAQKVYAEHSAARQPAYAQR